MKHQKTTKQVYAPVLLGYVQDRAKLVADAAEQAVIRTIRALITVQLP